MSDESSTTEVPLGDGVPPASPPDPPSASPGERVIGWLGAANSDRPQPSLMAAFGGIGGALAAGGFLSVAVGDDGDPRWKLLVLSLLLVALGTALRLLATPSVVKSMAIGLAVVGLPMIALTATVDDGASTFWTGALLGALCFAAWALPGFRHRHLFLGVGALAAIGALGSLTAPDPVRQDPMVAVCDQYMNEGDWESYDAECDDVYYMYEEPTFYPMGVTENIGEQGIVYLGGAVVFFGLTWWLDRRGRRGPGAALCTAGLVSSIVGAALLAADMGDDSGPILISIVGIVVSLVGSHGRRRATTWWGAAMASIGLVWFVTLQMEPDSARQSGGAVIIAGLLLSAIAAVAAVTNKQTDVLSAPPSPSEDLVEPTA